MNKATKRKNLSKKQRFEVFKRDQFTCQYCGKKAPDVVLHVDHIMPVSKGGSNRIANLVTSCIDCNLGKSNRLLSDKSAVEIQRKELDNQQERINQIKMMSDWCNSLIDVKSAEVDAVDSIFKNRTQCIMSDSGRKDIRKLLKKYSLSILLESTTCALDSYYDGDQGSWNAAFNKIGKIAKILIEPKHVQEFLKYCNYSKCHYSDYDTRRMQSLLTTNHGPLLKGVDFESLHTYGMHRQTFIDAVMDEIGLDENFEVKI